MGKYDPITTYFEQMNGDTPEVALTFGEIERILSAPLPNTARTDRTWWANTHSSNHGSKWLVAGWQVSAVDLPAGQIRFAKRGSVPRRKSSGYDRLGEFFLQLPEEQQQLALSFVDIENILDQPLPRTAYHDQPWWANVYKSPSPQCSAWVRNGWRVERVYFKPRIAVFRRSSHDPFRRIGRYVTALLEERGRLGRPSNEVLRRWMSFCRSVGWFFQGTVLYERSGLDPAALSEGDRADMEEDYAICKRSLLIHKRVGIREGSGV